MVTYLTTQEIAERLQVHVSTVRRWVRTKKLKGTPYGRSGYRIYEKDFLLFLCKRPEPPAPQRTHQEAEAEENQWRNLINFLPSNIWTAAADGTMTYVSDAWCEYTGMAPAEALGWGYIQTVHPDDQKRTEERWLEATQQGTGFEVIIRWRRYDGIYRWFLLQARPVKDKHGQVSSWVGAIIDINAQKLAEETVRESEERFHALADDIPIFIWMSDKEGNTTYVNRSLLEYMGMSSLAEFSGKAWEKLAEPQDLQRIYELHNHAIKTGKTYTLEAPFLNPQNDEIYKYFLLQAMPRYLASGEFFGFIGTAVDINNLKKTQEELATHTAFLRSVIESTPDLILMKDRSGTFVLANQATTRVFGKPPAEIIGHDDRAFFPPAVARTLMETDQRVMTTGKNEVIEETLPTAEGERTYLTTKSPLRNAEHEVIGLVLISRDITERKDLEQQKDDFMGVVSHELKTPVTSLKAFAQVLQNRFVKAGDERSAEILVKMDLQINKLTTLIRDLLDVTKLEAGKFQYKENSFFFEDLLREIIEETQRTTTKHQILLQASGTHQVFGDRERIGQVLINLLTNAIKYSPHAEHILVTSLAETQQMLVRVQDFGIGIPEDKHAHLFERFYRVSGDTFDTIPGLGLGLYISAEIIKRHGGKIWVESEASKGSTFCFTLPLKPADAENLPGG